jgi:hypothetical protein
VLGESIGVNLGLLDEASKVLMTKGKKYINWTSSKLKRFVLYRTSSRSQVWRCTSEVPALRRWRQEDHMFNDNMAYAVRPCLKKANKNNIIKKVRKHTGSVAQSRR